MLSKTGQLAYRSEDGAVELWRGDARDVLPVVPTESVDLLLTDPPYGAEWRSNKRAERFPGIAGDGSSAEDRAGINEALQEAVRCVRQHRHCYIFGPGDVLEGLKVSEPTELVWDKGRPGMGDLSSPWAPQHEPIQFAVGLWRHSGEETDSLAARLRKGSVLRCPPVTGRLVRHPSEKPVPLLRELIESSSRVGETILDPFAGVGSTGVAALLLGRRAILVELDPHDRYCQIAIGRLRAAERIAEQMRGA